MKNTLRTIFLAGAITLFPCKNLNKNDCNIVKYNKFTNFVEKNKNNLLTNFSTEFYKNKKEYKKLENKKQESFYEEYAKDYLTIYGAKLYSNEKLLSPDFIPDQEPYYKYHIRTGWDPEYFSSPRVVFRLKPKIRLLQYFLRNWKDKTFKVANKLWCKYHKTILNSNDPIVNIFKDAGINIDGEALEWVEVPEWRSGWTYREKELYWGETEIIMTVKWYSDELDDYIDIPAKKAWYKVSNIDNFKSTIANELSHEIQNSYFK